MKQALHTNTAVHFVLYYCKHKNNDGGNEIKSSSQDYYRMEQVSKDMHKRYVTYKLSVVKYISFSLQNEKRKSLLEVVVSSFAKFFITDKISGYWSNLWPP